MGWRERAAAVLLVVLAVAMHEPARPPSVRVGAVDPMSTPWPTVATTTTTTTTTEPPETTTTTGTTTTVAPRPVGRLQAAFEAAVPGSWRAAIPVRLAVIGGSTSWAHRSGLIEVSRYHVGSTGAKLRYVLAHEFGHLIAFRYGTQQYKGAAPKGWPPYGSRPEEAWADCVGQVFTGVIDPTRGPPCSGSSLVWTRDWLAAGPTAHSRTA